MADPLIMKERAYILYDFSCDIQRLLKHKFAGCNYHYQPEKSQKDNWWKFSNSQLAA